MIFKKIEYFVTQYTYNIYSQYDNKKVSCSNKRLFPSPVKTTVPTISIMKLKLMSYFCLHKLNHVYFTEIKQTVTVLYDS